MKKLSVLVLLIASVTAVYAQRQEDTSTRYKPIIPLERAKLLKNVDMIANMQFGFENRFKDGEHTSSEFRNEQFRLEIKGKVHDKVYFRFRDRYTRDPTTQSLDNISRSTDMAYIRVDATPKWSFSFGKMCADWGGYEFDYNPIDIYEYSDMIEYADNFLTGVGASYNLNGKHQFSGQVLNSRTATFDELYDSIPGVSESKFPLAFVANWRGSMWGGKFNTIWSYSLFVDAKNYYMHYVALGNQLKLKKFIAEYDLSFSSEALDRKGIVSDQVPKSVYPTRTLDVLYMSHWLKLDYRFHPQWSLSVIGMADIANWNGNPDPNKDNHFRTAYGIIPALEYFPFRNLNLKFYGSYVQRIYNYSAYAETAFGVKDYNTGRFTVGFISPLLIL